MFFWVYRLFLFTVICQTLHGNDKEDKDPYKSLKKKSVLDYTDADIERLYDQWEDADDEPLPEDELPEYKRPPPKIDMSQYDPNNPEGMLKMSKKGQTLMMFATVSGDPSERETEEITQIWQSSLFNAHIETQRYVVGKDRVLFMLKDGSTAWGIKDYLVEQDRCEVVTIEGKDYHGKGSSKYPADKDIGKEKKKEGKNKKNTGNKNIKNEL